MVDQPPIPREDENPASKRGRSAEADGKSKQDAQDSQDQAQGLEFVPTTARRPGMRWLGKWFGSYVIQPEVGGIDRHRQGRSGDRIEILGRVHGHETSNVEKAGRNTRPSLEN